MALGQLLVELGLNTVAFKGGCDKATYMAKQMAGEIKRSAQDIGNSFSELGNILGASFGPIGGIISGVTKGIEGVGLAVKQAGAGGPGLLAVATGFSAVGIAAGAAAVGVAELAKGAADTIESYHLMSEKTGISIRDLQTLKAVGESVNIPIEQIGMGFRRFSRALAEGSESGSRASVALHTLGVTSKEPYEAFLQLADGISKIQDPNKRAAEATAVFGQRIAQGLLPVLEKGRSGITEWSNVVDQFSGSIGKDAIDAQEKYKKSTVELSTAWEGLKLQFASAIPYLTKTTEFFAQGVAHPFGIGMGKGADVSPEEKAQQAAKSKQIEDADKLTESEKKHFEQVKAGGSAAYALEQANLRIKQDIDAEDYKDAEILQSRLPALKEAAKMEQQRLQALLNLPKTTAKAIDAEDMKVLSSYAAAVKALGPEHAEEARQLEVEASVQKYVNTQKEQGIDKDAAAIESARKYRDAVNAVTLATAELAKSAETGKLIQSFTDKTEAASKRAEELAGKYGMLAKVEAGLRDGLDKSMQALIEETTAYNLHAAAVNADADASQEEKNQLAREAALVDAHTTAINEQTKALDALIAKRKQEIIAEKESNRAQAISDTNMYIELLTKMPEADAKAVIGLEKEAEALYGVGAEAKAARDAYVALHAEEAKQGVRAEQKKEASNTARKTVEGPGVELQGLEDQKKFLIDNANEWKTNKLMADSYSKALQDINIKELQLKASAGNVSAGIQLGFAQWIKESKDVGKAISENIGHALNGVATGLAKTIVEGKNFGQAMRQVGIQVAEGFLEMEIKRLAAHAFTEVEMTVATLLGTRTREEATALAAHKDIMKDAKKAGAKGWTIGEEFPFPLNVVMPPILATAMFAGVMAYDAFEGGGIVSHTGMAKLHENEMVLPRPIAEKVQAMADPMQGQRNGGRAVSVTMNVVTPNADSFRRSQNQIQTNAHRAATKISKRNGG